MVRHRNTFQLGNLTVGGSSTGGVETSLFVKEWSLCFDMGICPGSHVPMNHVLLTHGHLDHIGALPAYLGQRQLYGLKPAQLFIDERHVDTLSRALDAFGTLQQGPLPFELTGVTPGEKITLRKGLSFIPFRSAHRVPTTGYTLYEEKTKLREAYLNLPGEEIARLREEGQEDLFEHLAIPTVTYPGDCLFDTVLAQDSVRKSRVLFLECTFFDDKKDVAHARLGGHIHFDEICDHADVFENEHIVLMHFSQIYESAEIRNIVNARLPESLRGRVKLLTRNNAQENRS